MNINMGMHIISVLFLYPVFLTSVLKFLCHNQVEEKKKKRHKTAVLAFPLDFGALSPRLAVRCPYSSHSFPHLGLAGSLLLGASVVTLNSLT